jgi:translation initiation factor 2 alpha subunit (eIF-2alpha)
MFKIKKIDRLLNPSHVKLSKEAQEVALQRFKTLEEHIKKIQNEITNKIQVNQQRS